VRTGNTSTVKENNLRREIMKQDNPLRIAHMAIFQSTALSKRLKDEVS